MTIDGVEATVTREAVVVTADRELTVVSSAFTGGDFTRARTLVNLHVAKNFACEGAEVA